MIGHTHIDHKAEVKCRSNMIEKLLKVTPYLKVESDGRIN